MTSTGELKPLHDRPTWISFGQISTWVWMLFAFGATQALLRDELGSTRSVTSLYSLAMASGGLICGFVFAALARRFGRRRMLRAGSFITIAGLLLYVTGTSVAVTIAGIGITGLGGAFIIVGSSAFLTDHQRGAAPAALSEGNAIGALAGLLAPLAVGACVAAGWGWRPAVLAACVALLVLELARGRTASYDQAAGGATEVPGRLPAIFWWSAILLTCTAGAEFCLTFWVADLLRDRGGFGAAAAAAGLSAVVIGMAIGRFGGARLAQVMDPERLLMIGIVVCMAGFAAVWITTVAWLMLAGLVVTGIGMGVHWPLGITRAVRASAGRSNRASAMASVATGLAVAAAPALLALLAQGLGIHVAFLLVPVLLLLALAIMLTRPVPASHLAPLQDESDEDSDGEPSGNHRDDGRETAVR